MKSEAGFNLIELMLVVGIISMLSLMGAFEYRSFVIHSMYGRAKGEMGGIATAVEGFRAVDDKTLVQIFNDPGNMLYRTMGCNIGFAFKCDHPATGIPYWKKLGYSTPPIDPWGNYYLLDENEMELSPVDCRHDSIWTAGQDDIWQGTGTGDSVFPDDLIYRIPFYHCRPDAKPILQGGK